MLEEMFWFDLIWIFIDIIRREYETKIEVIGISFEWVIVLAGPYFSILLQTSEHELFLGEHEVGVGVGETLVVEEEEFGFFWLGVETDEAEVP